MREFKFRVWDKTSKSFVCCSNDDDLFINMQGDIYLARETLRDAYDLDYWSSSFYEISQYTGLKDKKGKEIYEGDIVKFKGLFDIDKCENVEIVFDKGEFCIKWNGSICHNLLALNIDSIEVIGNIFENKELLK